MATDFSDGKGQSVFHVGRLAQFLKVGEQGFTLLQEILTDDELVRSIEKEVKGVDSWGTKTFESVFDFRLFRIVLYIAMRLKKPRVAIETGVLHGLTSAFLLRAIERNGAGKLISIDLPSYPDTGAANKDGYSAVLPVGKHPGWIVPVRLTKNWDLRISSSQDALPELNEISGLDFFLHDSEHTFETMWFELCWAWDKLEDGGYLFCDNIEASSAFSDFAEHVGQKVILFPAPSQQYMANPRFGLMVR
jgi:hypothetical protein